MEEEATAKPHKSNIILIGVGIVMVILLSAILFTLISKDKTAESEIEKNETGVAAENTTESNVKIIPVINNTDKVVILSDMLEINKANERNKKITGRVQNTGDVRAISIEITALLYDLNGTQVGKQTSRPLFNDLSPNQTSYFEISFYDDVTAAYRLSVSSK